MHRANNALRSVFTETEWRVLQARLTGARKAVDTLMARAPEITARILGVDGHSDDALAQLAPQSRRWMTGLIARLLETDDDEDELLPAPSVIVERAPLLKLVARTQKCAKEGRRP